MLRALIKKEWLEILREPSVLWVAVVLPAALLILFGFGLSMDLKAVPTAVILGERTAETTALAHRFQASPWFRTTLVPTRAEAERMMDERAVDLIVEMPSGFTESAVTGVADLGVTIHGIDASAAMIIRTYVAATIAQHQAARTERGETLTTGLRSTADAAAAGPITVTPRAWFNEANTSAWYLVPGLTVVIMTLVSSFLASVVVAREWERGTMESLASTPVSPVLLITAKFLAVLGLAALGVAVSLILTLFVFDVPVRGSFTMLLLTHAAYNGWALSFGLFLSALCRRQFVAVQMAVILSYLPALILSGFLFDLRSVPWWIEAVGRIMPPTYAVESVKILHLSGGSEAVILSNLGLLVLLTVVFLAGAVLLTPKRLENMETASDLLRVVTAGDQPDRKNDRRTERRTER